MSRELEAATDEIARIQVKTERAEQRAIQKELTELTAILVLNIAMGQAQLMMIKHLLSELPHNKMTDNLKGRQKQSLNLVIKSLQTAKGCLADFDTMQEEFTSSKRIGTEGQMIVAEDMVTTYHEIAELCSLYVNAYRSNKDIMRVLRPILLGQSRYDLNAIPPEVISKYKLLS